MFRWASPQPLPAALTLLLEQAGGWRSGLHEDPEITLFLPPHLLIAAGAHAEGEFSDAYAGFHRSAAHQRLVNGERLLGLRPAQIAHWLLGRALELPLELAAVADPLLAAVTLAQLEQRPELVEHYQRLDASSERGGAAAEHDYRQRLRPSPTDLLAAWDALGARLQSQDAGAGALQRLQQQRLELTEDLERQVIETHRVLELAERRRHTGRQLRTDLERMRRLMVRLLALQGRLLPGVQTRISS
ncbi:hypothetical protein [Cyanobium sp. CH-040]|uniref:hypothetical protein n=1 Tax=Cyanobium sp. CH-040 TaxID=2823708 RepID=UPI0020CC3F4A|nr:hypothetical protein [Cyanobium sp. CH-040]MCP9928006.1 hypothetical protein [Cyanobium sp. CH-040]